MPFSLGGFLNLYHNTNFNFDWDLETKIEHISKQTVSKPSYFSSAPSILLFFFSSSPRSNPSPPLFPVLTLQCFFVLRLLFFFSHFFFLHYIFLRFSTHTHIHTHTRLYISQIWTIHRIFEGVWAKNIPATLLFDDFTKAFDSIHRGKMEQILLAYGLPKETIAAITFLYLNTKVKVRSPDGDRILWHCSRSTTRGHASPIPLYYLSRLRA